MLERIAEFACFVLVWATVFQMLFDTWVIVRMSKQENSVSIKYRKTLQN